MIKGDTTSIDDLVGLLLQEEARLETELIRQSVVNPPTPSPNSSTPLALTVNRPSSRFSSSSSGPTSTTGPRTGDNRRRRLQCQLCSKPGHEAIDCWQRNNQQDYPSRRPRDQTRTAPRQAHLTHQNNPSTVTDPSWYFDTGATDHVAPDIQNLHIADAYKGPDKLQVGDGNNLIISHHCIILNCPQFLLCLKSQNVS